MTKKEKVEAKNDEILEAAIEKAENDGIFESTIEKTDESQCLYGNTATGRLVSDQGSQTEFSKHELSAKVESMILKNEVYTTKLQISKIVSSLSFEFIKRDANMMKHFIGLTPGQFEALYIFLDDVCPLDRINYWICKDSPATERAKTGRKSEFSSREKLFICLLRLRRGFTLKTMAALLSTPVRKIEETQVRKIFTTFLQLIYDIQRHAKCYDSKEGPTQEVLT